MSVFIKGAHMSSGCYECFYSSECFWKCNTISGNCPMLEVPDVHGNLIDAGELDELYRANGKIPQGVFDKYHVPIEVIRQNIEDMDVIIPAEKTRY